MRVLHGDCLVVLPTLEAASIDAVITDPPYGLEFMGKEWDRGVPGVAYWSECLRALKPGGHLIAFGGSRTYHRLACAIEDAGFEIRDQLQWLYGQGFPKSKSQLKPGHEPMVLARKPMIGTVEVNMARWGTGALNIEDCRVPTRDGLNGEGRWPANVIHDGSQMVLDLFPQTKSGTLTPDMNVKASTGWAGGSQANRVKSSFHANEGSAARFFYCAKATKAERAGSKHPTVKPIALLRWLARLVAPPSGIILDPFAGSGTMAQAAALEGRDCILIEREPEYIADIHRRMEGVSAHAPV